MLTTKLDSLEQCFTKSRWSPSTLYGKVFALCELSVAQVPLFLLRKVSVNLSVFLFSLLISSENNLLGAGINRFVKKRVIISYSRVCFDNMNCFSSKVQ